ncbi:MAG TPA: hypothetical protein VFS51_11245 [Gemmatimonadales bacterium]|nr:hypothetical protein [Gemmatimonadales bacterium]
MTQAPADPWIIPELGPSLGRLADPPLGRTDRGPLDLVLDDIRLDLVTGLFETAGAARSFVAAGDRQGAIASLSRVAWLALWERAVAAAAERLAEVVNARLTEAAAESRLPRKQLEASRLKAEDIRAIASRLGSGGAGFVSALDALEQTVPGAAASGTRGWAGQEEWQRTLATVARRLESAWHALAASARVEQERWKVEIEAVRSWRRPSWPLWALTGTVLAIVTYLGLVLGGYLPVPQPLRGLAEFWWARL